MLDQLGSVAFIGDAAAAGFHLEQREHTSLFRKKFNLSNDSM